MNRKIKVLVDGAGGDVGQGVLKALLSSTLNLELYASCISSSSSWLYKIKKSYIFPYVSDENFIDFIINFLNQNKIDVYFPTVDSTLIKISKYKNIIEKETNVKIFIDNLTEIKICDDKFLTYKFLKENNFNTPKTISLDDNQITKFLNENNFPLVLKTKSGNGAKNVLKVSNIEELKPFIGNSEWLVQEYLDIQYEITSGIYIGNDNEVKGIYILKRTLKCGSTFSAERIIDKELENKLIKIAKKMNMRYINIQAIYKDNELLPFEFNGRLSGTTGAMRDIFNVPEIFIREEILKEKVEESKNREKIFFTRYNEEVVYTQSDVNSLFNRSGHE